MLSEHSDSWMIVHCRVRGERAKVTKASKHFSTVFRMVALISSLWKVIVTFASTITPLSQQSDIKHNTLEGVIARVIVAY